MPPSQLQIPEVKGGGDSGRGYGAFGFAVLHPPVCRSHLISIKAAEQRRFPQFLVGSEKDAAGGNVSAPHQGRRQVQGICRTEVITTHKLDRFGAEGIGRAG